MSASGNARSCVVSPRKHDSKFQYWSVRSLAFRKDHSGDSEAIARFFLVLLRALLGEVEICAASPRGSRRQQKCIAENGVAFADITMDAVGLHPSS